MDYEEVINSLVRDVGIPQSEIFIFEEMPNEAIYRDLFNFFQASFGRDFNWSNIFPSYFYYGTSTEVNARASKRNDNYLIRFNSGIIVNISSLFLMQQNLLNKCSNRDVLNTILSETQDSFNNLLLQSAFLFIFYHEVGHLIQFNNLNYAIDRLEINSSDNLYSELVHVLETDADMFSGIQMGRHILKYWEKINEKNVDNLAGIASIICAGSSIFSLVYIEFSNTIYYKEQTHPHSIIRIFIMIDTMINYSLLKLGVSSTAHETREIIVRQTLTLLDELLPIILGKSARNNLINLYRGNEKDIFNYAQELIGKVNEYSNSAVKRFNEMAKQTN